MKRMESPSVVGVAVATARVDQGVTAMTMTGMRVTTATFHHAQIPSRYHCRHRQAITEKRTRRAIKSREALPPASCLLGGDQALLSNRHFKQLSREIAVAQPSVNSPRLRWSTNKIGFDEEDHPIPTRAVGTIPLLCTPTINNIAVNHTFIDGGAGLNIISVEVFKKMQVPYHRLMPIRPFFRVIEGSTTPVG
jgi:hypothetical protein